MARIRVGEIEMGYEILGADDGEPVVFIQGLGGPKEGWRFQAGPLSEEFRILIFDNRGVGDSDRPDHRYSIPMFASDLSGLMVALGWDSAHIVGGSMGGMIAQEFALAFPYKVRSLTLLYTTPGGRSQAPPRSEAIAHWSSQTGKTDEELAQAGAEIGYSKGFREANPELMTELIAGSVKEAPEPQMFLRHLDAAMRHDASTRLHHLDMPVLLAHGTDDWLLPHENSQAIQGMVRGSRLELFEGAGHALGIEYQDELNGLLASWFREHS